MKDAVTVATSKASFRDIVLIQNYWHHIKISLKMKNSIKCSAFYRNAPISAIADPSMIELV